MKKILYLGKDDSYISDLKGHLGEELFLENFDSAGEFEATFSRVLISMPALIIIDFPVTFSKLNKLVRMIRLNEKLFPIPILCLIEEKNKKDLDTISLLWGIVYFIKSMDKDDVIYTIKNLLVPELVVHHRIAKAFFTEKTQIIDVIRIKSVSASYAQIESNRLFKEGEELKVQFPFFTNLFRIGIHRVSSVATTDIQSPFSYSYRLEYQFHYDQLRPEDRTKLLTEFKYKFENLPIKEFTYEIIQEFDKKPKKVLLVSDKKNNLVSETTSQYVAASIKTLETSSKALILNWVYEQAKDRPLTEDSITIYHQQYGLLKTGTPFLDREGTVVQMRQFISSPKNEILRDKPSVIAIRIDESNSLDKVSELVQATMLLRDYFPFFILFNFSAANIEEVRSKLQYHFVITTMADVSESVIVKMLGLYRKKKEEKELKRIYKFLDSMKLQGLELGIISEKLFYDYKAHRKLEDKENYMQISLPVEIRWISEFEVVFTTDQELRIGQTYIAEIPMRLHILIVPHILGSKESLQKNFYRGLIHFISENEKKMLRRFVNHVSTVSASRGKPLLHNEVVGLKKQFFLLERKI